MALTGDLPEIPISHRGLVQCGWHPNHSMPMTGAPMCCTEVADVAFLIFDSMSPATSVKTAEKCRPPCSTLASMLLAAGVQASAGHPFAQATFYQEGFF